jgi:AcrR family transcriptional regulator
MSRKQDIIETAIQIAHEKGWSSVSVRKISERINYSTIIIYSEFGNKEALINAIKEHGFKILLDILKQRCEGVRKNHQLIRLITNDTLDFYLQNKELYQIMFGVLGLQGVRPECSENTYSSTSSAYIKEVLAEILHDDAQSLFINWWSIIHGFISIGATISDEKFKAMKPYLDDAITRFIR